VILGNSDGATRAQQELLCSRHWQDLTNALGYPVLRSSRGHQPLRVDVLKEAASKADEGHVKHLSRVSDCNEKKNVFSCTEYAEAEVQGIGAGQVSVCVELLDEAALYSMVFALQSQGVLAMTGQEYSEAEILTALKVAPRHKHVILRWLCILTERGYLKQNGMNFLCNLQVTWDTVKQSWDLVKEAWNGKLGSPAVIDYLITNVKQLQQLVTDKQQAALLLFPEGRMDIADALYRDTVMARYLNRSVAEAVIRIAREKQARDTISSEVSLRILEIGAGTGATTDMIVARLKAATSKWLKPDYLFTDISNFFLANARSRFKDCPWMDFQVVDIDKSFIEQGLKPESVDIVIAAGMLNNARDTDKAIQGLMKSLVPGGWMLITEPTREFLEMLISQAFMMTIPDDDRKNTKSTFMTVEQWLEVFHKADVQEVVMLPGEGHALAPLGQKLFVVHKGDNA
jgi:SAM-dependent methyltransferase